MLRGSILASDVYRTWPVFACIGMQTRDGVKVERFDDLLRQEPLINIDSDLNYRIQKLILAIPVGNRQRFVIRVIFCVEKLE